MNNKVMYTSDILIFMVDSRENKNVRELPKKYFSILLVKRDKEPFKDMWCLPGGYVGSDENSYESAVRILKKETNLSKIYVEKVSIYDDVKRDPRGRTVSSTYMALVDRSKISDKLSENAKWFDIEVEDTDNSIDIRLVNEDEISIKIDKKIIDKKSNLINYCLNKSSNIAFDHGLIISDGIVKLREKAEHTDILFNLMPKEFTVGELKQVYEIILNKKLINSAFRRVIGPKIEEVSEIVKTGGHRPSRMFRYKG